MAIFRIWVFLKHCLGSTYIAKQLLFSMLHVILISEFDLILESIFGLLGSEWASFGSWAMFKNVF